MDLLFKRYASPFLFLDGMIQTGRFSEFVSEFVSTVNEEKDDQLSWEYFLHKVQNGSFKDFKEELENDEKNKNITAATIEETVQNSLNILNNFNPERGEN